jgi:cytochrome P450
MSKKPTSRKSNRNNLLNRVIRYLISPLYKSEKHENYSFLKIGKLRAHETKDPELVRKAFAERETFAEPQFVGTTLEKIVGNALPVDKGESWKHMRKLLGAAFSPNAVKNEVAPIILKECQIMLDRWENTKGVINIGNELQKTTGKIIASRLWGNTLSEEESQTIIDLAGKTLNELEGVGEDRNYSKSSAMPYEMGNFRLSIIKKILGLSHDHPGLIPDSIKTGIKKAESILYPAIQKRRSLKTQPNDILGRLIDATKHDGTKLSDTEIKDQLVTLVVAGHETTTIGTTFALDEILKCSHVQNKIRDEYNTVSKSQKLKPEDVLKLKYTTKAFEEALRMHPPISSTSREISHDLNVDDIEFRKHDLVKMDVKGLHMRKDLWGDPEKYRPERFKESGCPVKAWNPFGYGPRTCLGNVMARYEGTIFLSQIFNRFDVKPVKHLEGEKRFFTVHPKGDLLVKVKPRKIT